MISRGSRKAVDPHTFRRYHRVGVALRKSAEDLAAIAVDGDTYGNAIALSAIHACIAQADALCVRFGGFKSSEGDHLRAIDALREAIGDRTDEAAIKRLRRALAQKDQVSYQGDYYTVDEAKGVVTDMSAFCTWVDGVLD